MELGPEDVSLLERCPHFIGWYVQASMELGPEDVPIRKVSSFQADHALGTNICSFSTSFTSAHTCTYPCGGRESGQAVKIHPDVTQLPCVSVE